MRIAIDMDEVLADTHVAKRALYAARGREWDDTALRGRKMDALADDVTRAAVEAVLKDGTFFAGLEPMEGAIAAVRDLATEHEIFIATAAMEYPASCPHKFAWLQRHMPFIDPLNIVFCGDKSIVAADVLIDDNARHFERFGGTGILFSALHNMGAEAPHRLDRWTDAAALVRSL